MFEAHDVDLVLDVGAARGSYASELRQFGYHGQIVSFEPLAAAYTDLVAASDSDRRWETCRLALGEHPGSAEINVASNSDSSSLLPMATAHIDAAPGIAYIAREQIEVARLDDVAPLYVSDKARPFLKLDTQGFEGSVLAGGSSTLARCAGLQIELSFVSLYEGGMLVDEAVSFAYDNGFVMTALDQGFTDPAGAILQADGIFFRADDSADRSAESRGHLIL